MNNNDKMDLINEGSRNAAMRLRVVAEQGRSGQFSCPEMALAASAILALRAEVARLGGELEVYERHFERFRVDLAKAIRERDAVCRYAAGLLAGKPELILENALKSAGYVPGPLRPPAAASDLVGYVCSACGTRATRVGDAISCEKCGTGRWVSKQATADGEGGVP